MRGVSVVVVSLLVVVPGWASFDMVLVNSGNQIHRVDPVNGAYLGAINTNFWCLAMTASFSSKRVYAMDSNRIMAWDYSTGEQVASSGGSPALVLGLGMTRDHSSLLACGNGIIDKYDPITLARTSFISDVTYQFKSVLQHSDGRFIAEAYNNTNHFIKVFSSSGVLLQSYQVEAGQSNSYRYGLAYLPYTSMFYFGTGVTGQYGSAFYNTTTGQITSSTVNLPATGLSTITAVFNGHTGMYWTGLDQTAANGFAVQRYDPYFNRDYRYSWAQIANPQSAAIVLAPEPASLTALALGGLALIRRRRQGK